MGYTIIKASGNAYALNRSMQNLTPVDSEYRKLIPNDATFTYNHVTQDGICTLQSVDLKGGTLPYVYKLCDSTGTVGSRAGVTINEINGVIILDDNYDGLDVYVKLLPLQIQDHLDFYPSVVTTIFKKVIAAGDWSPGITPEPTTHTASLDSITYVIGSGTGWPQGIPASGATLILKNATITYDGTTTTFGDATAINTMAADVSNVNITAKIGSTSVLGSNPSLKLFTINPTNATESRDINIGIKFDYKGISVTYLVTIPQQANELNSVSNITGPQQVNVGTTLVASNYSATGNYSNGTTGTINAISISPSVVTEGTNNYTLTFGNNVTGTISITGQLTVVSKAYISRFASNPYPQSAELVNGTSISIPLMVHVIQPNLAGDGITESDMSLIDYQNIENRETYSAPVVTFLNDYLHKTINYTVDNNGTLSMNLTDANYIYDKTEISNIHISCTSNSSRIVEDYVQAIKIEMHKQFSTYFTQNFLSLDISSVGTQIAFHNSESNSNKGEYVGKIKITSGGTGYELPALEADETGYYLKIGKENYVGIISTSDSALTDDASYLVDGVNVKVFNSTSTPVYVHHTPTVKTYHTFIVGYGAVTDPVWQLLERNPVSS